MKHILSDKLVTLITPDQASYQEGKMKAGTIMCDVLDRAHLELTS